MCETPKLDARNLETTVASFCSLFYRSFLLLDNWSSRGLNFQDLEELHIFEVVVRKIIFSLKISPESRSHTYILYCFKNFRCVCLNLGGPAG